MEPYRLTLEFSRKNKVDDKYAFKVQAQTYHRRLAGGAYAAAELSWSDDFIEAIDQLRASKRDPEVMQRLGNTLRSFLDEMGWGQEQAALRTAVDEDRRVVITVRSAAAELYAVPWEIVTLGQTMRHLGWLPNVLVQYEWVDDQPNKSVPEKPFPRPEGGRILFAHSAAAGDVPHKRHLEAIEDACLEAHHDFHADRDVLSGASLGTLRKALDDASCGKDKPISVLHLLCHGGPVGSTFGLLLDPDEDGGAVGVDPATFANLCAPYAGMVRLVVIAACDSGNIGPLGNQMGSVAQALHRAGVSAVVASRFPLSKKGSNAFAEAFYRALLVEPCSVESAFLMARRRLVEVDSGRVDWASLQLYAREADGLDTRPIVVRPYQGLLPLGPAHNRFFFGREKEVQEIVSDLGALVKSEQPRFLVVQGWSGTGKSSMVMAGAVPRLTKPADPSAGAPGDPGWSPGYACIKMKPGGDPMRSLFTALDQDERRPLLLVVDQFEEIFTQASEEERNKFARELWSLARDTTSGISVIVTIRSDFIGRCGEVLLDDHATRLDAIANNEAFSVRVSQLSKEQLRETIEKPAAKVGLLIPRSLVNTILNDIGQSLGALPLVAHTMNLLWQDRRGRELSLETYDQLGKVTGALYQHADQLIRALDEPGQKMAERLFVGLVGKDAEHDGGAPADTRRRLRVKEIRTEVCQGIAEKEACFERMLQSLDTGRLLVIEGEGDAKTVEVAHEALIRGWKTLEVWLEKYGDMLRRKKELDRWLAGHTSHGTLLNERQIDTVAAFKKDYPEVFSAIAQELLATSRAKIVAARRRERIALVVAVVAAIVMSGLGVWASIERSKARAQTEVALKAEADAKKARDAAQTASRMAVARELLARGQHAMASKVLLEVAEPEKVRGWIELATDVLLQGVERTTLRHDADIISAEWSPDGKRIVTTCTDNAVRVWNADGTGAVVRLDIPKAPTSATWSPDGKRILVDDATNVRIWSPDCVGAPVELPESARGNMVWSPDGKRMATISANALTTKVWNADGTGPAIEFVHKVGISFVVWSPDSRRLMTFALDDSAVWIWNLDDGRPTSKPIEIRTPHGGVENAAWSPNGRQFVVVNQDGDSWILNSDGTGTPLPLINPASEVCSYRFNKHATWSPDGKSILAVASNPSVCLWDAAGKKPPIELRGHGDQTNYAAWSPDGQRILTASDDKTARIWELSHPQRTIVFKGHEFEVNSAQWSPTGDRILTVSRDQMVRVWNARGVEYPVLMDGEAATADSDHDSDGFVGNVPIYNGMVSASWSPDGKRIVTVMNDGTAWAWNGDGHGRAIELPGYKGDRYNDRWTWSPDKTRVLVTTSGKTEARVQRVDSKDGAVILRQTEEISVAAWSPDGHRIATATNTPEKNEIRNWNADGQGESSVIKTPASVDKIVWNPDARRILATSEKQAWILNADGTGTPVVLPVTDGAGGAPFRRLTDGAWSPNGKQILTWCGEKNVKVWNTEHTGDPVVLPHDTEVWDVEWSTDNVRIATRTSDGVVRIWDSATKQPLVLNSRQYRVDSMAWNPQGDRIVTNSPDKIVRIWSTDGSGDVIALKGHLYEILSVAWSPDGSQVVTTSKDNMARIWFVTAVGLQKTLRNANSYCLTPEQREHLLLENKADAQVHYDACERSYHRSFGPNAECRTSTK